MKNSKALLSLYMVLIIIMVSVAPGFAVIAPDDSAPLVQPYNKIDAVLAEKMESLSDDECIPVWVWMTDIDTEKLENDIEAKTGLSYQNISNAKKEVNDSNFSTAKFASEIQNVSAVDIAMGSYSDASQAEIQKVVDDSKRYYDTKKQLAKVQYTATNTAKIKQLGVDNSKIDFKSSLTPSFIAYLTKDEIIEMSQSNDVLEMGYFGEYEDDEVEAPTAVEPLEVNDDATEYPTLDVSTLHTGIKEEIEHDKALEKYGVTGSGIKVLHVDSGYVRSDKDNFYYVPHPEKVYNLIEKETYEVTDIDSIPLQETVQPGKQNVSHTNTSVSYLQSFAEDVTIYSVPNLNAYDELKNHNINPLDDVEYAIVNLGVDLISSSSNERELVYAENFSARWYDAIVATYNIPLIASAGNSPTRNQFYNVIAPACGYNSIGVGVYRYNTNKMEDDYAHTSSTTDEVRVTYKPDLVVAMDTYTFGSKGYFGATSAGAPVVSGIVAMMLQKNPLLKGEPAVIKSILMASCHEKALRSSLDETENIAQEQMANGLTLKQGAGKVNALRALNIVNYGTYGYITIPGNANSKTTSIYNLNSYAYGDSSKTYPLNVSIAWLRNNEALSNIPSENNIILGTKHEINLKVSYTNQNTNDIKKSETENSGKQLVFYENPVLDKDYTIRMYRGENDANRSESVKVGYAYSIGNFEKMIENVEIEGRPAIGETLTAKAYTSDETLVPADALDYIWYSSTDKVNWQMISGEYSSNYTITSSDLGKYFKCVVIQDFLNLPELNITTQTAVVRFGDVDGDGSITPIDATMINRATAFIIELTPEQEVAADVNLDGIVDSQDALCIQQYLSGQGELPVVSP